MPFHGFISTLYSSTAANRAHCLVQGDEERGEEEGGSLSPSAVPEAPGLPGAGGQLATPRAAARLPVLQLPDCCPGARP